MRISDWSSDVCSSDLRGRITFLSLCLKGSRYQAPWGAASPNGPLRRRVFGMDVPAGGTDAGRTFTPSSRVNSPVSSNALISSRSEEHTSELQSLMRISYAVFCLKKKKITTQHRHTNK